jgi:hypothetical protein
MDTYIFDLSAISQSSVHESPRFRKGGHDDGVCRWIGGQLKDSTFDCFMTLDMSAIDI